MVDDIMKDLEAGIAKALDSLKRELAKVRTGRANLARLDGVRVDYYGTPTPLNQMANLSSPDPRLIVISPFDKSTLQAIEKAIQASDLGLTPNNDGSIIRLQIPELTEERRRQLVKVVRGITEEGKIALRNIRRDVMHDLKELKDAGEAGADDEHRAEEALQKLTNEKVAELDALLKAKEAEITEV